MRASEQEQAYGTISVAGVPDGRDREELLPGGEKLLRTQPAISLAVQRLEEELGEKLLDRTGRELMLTDAGTIVLEYCRRFENLERELENALAELRDKSAGRLVDRRQRIDCALSAAAHRAATGGCTRR